MARAIHVPITIVTPTAAAEGRTACIRLLISAGARLSFDRWNNSPLVDAMNYANRTGDSEPIRLLRSVEGRAAGHVEECGVLDSHHRTTLVNQAAMIAAADGDVDGLEKLITSGLDLNCCDYDRRTPLMVSYSAHLHHLKHSAELGIF